MNNIKSIRFYTENGKWYADVPGHSKAENLMVCGSDRFLQALYDDMKVIEAPYIADELQMFITTEKPSDESTYAFVLKRILHDKFGATYRIKKNQKSWIHYNIRLPKLCWLCNVVHTFLGEHPKSIYIMCL